MSAASAQQAEFVEQAHYLRAFVIEQTIQTRSQHLPPGTYDASDLKNFAVKVEQLAQHFYKINEFEKLQTWNTKFHGILARHIETEQNLRAVIEDLKYAVRKLTTN